MAEYYGVHNFQGLPLLHVATLVSGLRAESRVKMSLAGVNHTSTDIMLAGILDRVSLLLWAQSEDGRHGRNRPQSMVNILLNTDAPENMATFENGEAFDKARQEILNKLRG